MFDLMTRYWWVLVLRGILAVLLGVLAFGWPGLTIEAFIVYFGAYALVDGVFSIFNAVAGRGEDDDWWIMLLGGVAGVVVGIVAFRAPGIAAAALLLYVAAWALAKGVLEIVAAIRLRKVIEGEIWLALAGLASIVFAFLLMAYPLAGALSLLWVVATYAIVFGVLMIVLGFRVRSGRRPQLA
jgi:uncharacterized membrane protein HdeD (DUF308 family)